jgi:hypothetical protein
MPDVNYALMLYLYDILEKFSKGRKYTILHNYEI